MLRRRDCLIAAGLAAIGKTAPAAAQPGAAYPTRPVRVLVGFAAGGGNDIVARIVGERLSKALGQPVVVENRPGNGGILASAHLITQAPDGYTILVGSSGAMSIAPAVYAKMPYAGPRDFTPVSLVGDYPLVLLVHGEAPYRTVAEFVAWTKANKAEANYATSSPTFTISTELFRLRTGAELERIPYRSTNESVVSVLGKQATATLSDVLPAIGLIQEGKLRALAVTADARIPELPDVPTMAEAGVPDMQVSIWTGIFAPPKLPPDLLAKLQAASAEALADPETRKRLRALSIETRAMTGADFSAFMARDSEKWAAVAKAADLKIDP